MWPRKRQIIPPPDVQEARQLRAEVEGDMRQLQAQASYVARLSARLVERRELNHFGDDITISFTPRGTNA